jgi:hypothetical protein
MEDRGKDTRKLIKETIKCNGRNMERKKERKKGD